MARRNPRVDGQVREAIADAIESHLADPRLTFVTITDVEVTPDHRYADVYYTALDPDIVSRDPGRTGGDRVPDAAEVAEGLDSAVSRIQGLVSRRVRLRNTPQLRFTPDPVAAQATRVEQLLRDLPETGGPRGPARGA